LTRRPWRPTRRCEASCGARRGRVKFLERLAKASGIETPRRAELARLDRKRPGKGSNDNWQHPHDPEAEITKMKDGRTHLSHKAEHATDMASGAVVAVTLSGGAEGDTHTLPRTLQEAERNLGEVARDPEAKKHLSNKPGSEVVTDKGYHSNETCLRLRAKGIRSYISEPDRLPVHVCGFNLTVALRKLIGCGTPKGLGGRPVGVFGDVLELVSACRRAATALLRGPSRRTVVSAAARPTAVAAWVAQANSHFQPPLPRAATPDRRATRSWTDTPTTPSAALGPPTARRSCG